MIAIVNHGTGLKHGANRLFNNDTFQPNKDKGPDSAWGYNIDDSFTWGRARWVYFQFGQPVEGK